jgi:hypothetical protein
MILFDTEFFGKTHEVLTNNYYIAIPRNGPLKLIDISTPNFQDVNINYNPGFLLNTQDTDINIDSQLAILGHTGNSSKINFIPAIGSVFENVTEPVTSCSFDPSSNRLFIGSTTGARVIEYDTSSGASPKINTVATTTIANIQRAKYTVTNGVTRLFVISNSTNLLYELNPTNLNVIRAVTANTSDAGSLEFDISHDGYRLGYLNSRRVIIRDISTPGGNWALSGAVLLDSTLLSYPQSISFIRGTTNFLIGGFRTTTLPAIRRYRTNGTIAWTLDLSPNNKTRNTTTVRRLRTDQTGQYFSYSVNSSSTENDIRNFEIRSTANASLLYATFQSVTDNNSIACGFSYSSTLL